MSCSSAGVEPVDRSVLSNSQVKFHRSARPPWSERWLFDLVIYFSFYAKPNLLGNTHKKTLFKMCKRASYYTYSQCGRIFSLHQLKFLRRVFPAHVTILELHRKHVVQLYRNNLTRWHLNCVTFSDFQRSEVFLFVKLQAGSVVSEMSLEHLSPPWWDFTFVGEAV